MNMNLRIGDSGQTLERLKQSCSHSERGFLGSGEALAKEQVSKNPVTEPKRLVRRSLGEGGSQDPKRPLSVLILSNGYSIFENALASKCTTALMICALAGLLSGCVIYTHDSKIKKLQPAQAELKDFAGRFRDRASYVTPPNILGLVANEKLGETLGGTGYESNVQIEITTVGDIVVKSDHGRFALDPLHYVNGKDFEFKNHCVLFSGKNQFGGGDSPGFVVGSGSMTWMLDDSRNLVVIAGGSGVGLFTIIPFAISGKLLSIFPRTW